MENQIEDIALMLPSGDDLRVFLNQQYITPSLLRSILRKRGVFMSSTEKKDLIPLFLLSYLTPSEFDLLIGTAIKSEDEHKIRSHTYNITASDFSLIELVPDDLDINTIAEDPYGNYEFISAPYFSATQDENTQQLLLPYQIKATDVTCDWLKSNRIYEGQVKYIFDKRASQLKVVTIHTSSETKNVNSLISKKIDRDIKKSNKIHEEAIRVLFDSFSNEQRIAFFMHFTKISDSSDIALDKLMDLSLKLDESKSIDHENLEWMRGKVSSVKMGGKALQDTFFVTDISCRPYVIFHRVEFKYKFDISDGKGSFVAVYEFPESKKGASSEFQIRISSIHIKGRNTDGILQKKLRDKFLSILNNKKQDIFASMFK